MHCKKRMYFSKTIIKIKYLVSVTRELYTGNCKTLMAELKDNWNKEKSDLFLGCRFKTAKRTGPPKLIYRFNTIPIIAIGYLIATSKL